VNTPPNVSIPNDNGVTSSNNTSLTSPVNTPPWIAAPIDTASSGLTLLLGSLPNSLLTNSWTAGIRVEPPTNNTWSRSFAVSLASDNALLTGPKQRWTKSSVKVLNWALVKVVFKSESLTKELKSVYKYFSTAASNCYPVWLKLYCAIFPP
jgi:hypothetical protein